MNLKKKARSIIEHAIQQAIDNKIFDESHKETICALVFDGKTANEVNTKCFDYDQADYIEILVSEYKAQREGYTKTENDQVKEDRSPSDSSHELLFNTHQKSRGIMFDFSPLDQY